MVVTWLLGKDRVQVLMCGGKCLAKTGVKVGTEFLLNTTVSGNQRYPEIQFYPDGTFVAGFVDASQTVLQRFTADGRPIGLETRISSGTGTTTLSVAPTTVTASDIVTVSMTLTNPTTLNNAKPCPLTVYGTNGVFATPRKQPRAEQYDRRFKRYDFHVDLPRDGGRPNRGFNVWRQRLQHNRQYLSF